VIALGYLICKLKLITLWFSCFYRPSWLIDSRRIASKIKNASEETDPTRAKWPSNPTKSCPNCNHVIDNSDVRFCIFHRFMNYLLQSKSATENVPFFKFSSVQFCNIKATPFSSGRGWKILIPEESFFYLIPKFDVGVW
jgi:hypothetical protein